MGRRASSLNNVHLLLRRCSGARFPKSSPLFVSLACSPHVVQRLRPHANDFKSCVEHEDSEGDDDGVPRQRTQRKREEPEKNELFHATQERIINTSK